jgi:hypothetical protein
MQKALLARVELTLLETATMNYQRLQGRVLPFSLFLPSSSSPGWLRSFPNGNGKKQQNTGLSSPLGLLVTSS